MLCYGGFFMQKRFFYPNFDTKGLKFFNIKFNISWQTCWKIPTLFSSLKKILKKLGRKIQNLGKDQKIFKAYSLLFTFGFLYEEWKNFSFFALKCWILYYFLVHFFNRVAICILISHKKYSMKFLITTSIHIQQTFSTKIYMVVI